MSSLFALSFFNISSPLINIGWIILMHGIVYMELSGMLVKLDWLPLTTQSLLTINYVHTLWCHSAYGGC